MSHPCFFTPVSFLVLLIIFSLNQDLSYGEILAGRPGAWLVKKIYFHMHAIKKVKKGTYIEIKNNFQNMFRFMIAFMVYE